MEGCDIQEDSEGLAYTFKSSMYVKYNNDMEFN